MIKSDQVIKTEPGDKEWTGNQKRCQNETDLDIGNKITVNGKYQEVKAMAEAQSKKCQY